MQDHQYIIIARALHVAAVVLWIGGVGFVATVLIPALKKIAEPARRLALFEALERRFSLQAKGLTLAAGLSGLYMLFALDAWNRYLRPEFWWMHLMTPVWLIFSLVLFVLEPLFLHRWFHARVVHDGERAFDLLHNLHLILLTLSVIAVLGAVAGSHGF